MSEFRQDAVSGDWIINVPERAKRPHDFIPPRRERPVYAKDSCPFEDLQKSGNWPPVTLVPNKEKWRVAVIPNKYPALTHAGTACAKFFKQGPYAAAEGLGHHQLVITRDHRKNFAHLSTAAAVEVLAVMQDGYRKMDQDPCLDYVSGFFNWGVSAGASISHPHYQILALPIIPPDVAHSLRGSEAYFRRHKWCVHCQMLAYELKVKRRILEKNSGALAVTPYVSREPFEVRIFPARHLPYFEKTPRRDLSGIVKVLQSSLRRIEKYLNDPDFNFFIHTAPIKDQPSYRHYHWHIEIVPKVSIPAGFELSTGIEINVIDPDRAAAILRGKEARH